MKHLMQKSFEGAFWLGLLKVVIKIFSLLKIVVAIRILTPQEIGAFGMIMLPYGLAEVATESGINQALVQTTKDTKRYLSLDCFPRPRLAHFRGFVADSAVGQRFF